MAISDSRVEKRAELVLLATAMIEGRLNLIDGVRKIASIRHHVGDPENEVFVPIRAIESETDHFPLGQMRQQCADDYLRRMDEEMDRYLATAKDDIMEACKAIVRAFSQ